MKSPECVPFWISLRIGVLFFSTAQDPVRQFKIPRNKRQKHPVYSLRIAMKIFFHQLCLVLIRHIQAEGHQIHFAAGNMSFHIISTIGRVTFHSVFLLAARTRKQIQCRGNGPLPRGRGHNIIQLLGNQPRILRSTVAFAVL